MYGGYKEEGVGKHIGGGYTRETELEEEGCKTHRLLGRSMEAHHKIHLKLASQSRVNK